MKKIIACSMAILLTLSLTACGSGNAPASEPSESQSVSSSASAQEEKPAEKIKVRFAAQGDSTPATQTLIDAFNDSQDKYEAEWLDMTNDSGAMRDQLTTTLKSGSAEYDVLSLDVVWAGEFAAAGYIEPIDSYLKDSNLSIRDFNAGSMASGSYNAKQYVLPFFPDLGVLYFRKDIVSADDAAKLESGDYTYTDLLAMAEKYQGEGGTKDGFVYQSALYEGLICNANEFTNNWNDLEAGLQTMKAAAESKATPENILNYTEGETANSFIKGESIFSRNWPYQWGAIKSEGTIKNEQVGIAPLPNGGSVGGWLLAINKNSQNKEGAWELMKFIATMDGQKIMSIQGGYLPGYNAALKDSEVLAANEMLNMPGFNKALTKTIARPVSSEYAKLSDELQQNIHKYLSGSQSIEDTVAAVSEALNAK